MSDLGLKTDGSPAGVKMLKQGFNVDPLIQKQAECVSTMTYNEYWQVIDAGFKPSQRVVFKYVDEGQGCSPTPTASSIPPTMSAPCPSSCPAAPIRSSPRSRSGRGPTRSTT